MWPEIQGRRRFLNFYNFLGRTVGGFLLAWLPVVHLASLFDHGIFTLILSTSAALLIGILYAILACR